MLSRSQNDRDMVKNVTIACYLILSRWITGRLINGWSMIVIMREPTFRLPDPPLHQYNPPSFVGGRGRKWIRVVSCSPYPSMKDTRSTCQTDIGSLYVCGHCSGRGLGTADSRIDRYSFHLRGWAPITLVWNESGSSSSSLNSPPTGRTQWAHSLCYTPADKACLWLVSARSAHTRPRKELCCRT